MSSEMDILDRAVRDRIRDRVKQDWVDNVDAPYLYIKDLFDQGCSIPALAWIFKVSESTIANCITQAVRKGY